MRNHEWLNRNCLRSYPLKEDVSRVSINTLWELPNNLLCDAFLTGPVEAVYLSAVCITPMVVSLVFAEVATGRSIATVSAILGQTPAFSRVAVKPLLNGVGGSVSFGDALEPEAFAALQQGAHYFDSRCRLETRAFMGTGEFPVSSLSAFGAVAKLQGTVSLQSNDQVVFGVSEGSDNGDPVSLITLSLANPSQFLSPCEEKTNPCDCEQTPLRFLNSVGPDENGKIAIELIDEHGNLVPFGENGLALTILRDGEGLCVRPKMPDAAGRLPGASGEYDKDRDPVTEYPH